MRRLIILALAALFCLPGLMAENRIVVSKKDYKLYVIDDNDRVVFTAPVCLGINKGNKKRRGDHKTPEGNFSIMSIEDSRMWKDFDGKYRASYGPWFMRLKVPGFRSIGIHGTNEPESLGTRASMGCIRLENSQVEKLKQMVKVGTKVTILCEDEAFSLKPVEAK